MDMVYAQEVACYTGPNGNTVIDQSLRGDELILKHLLSCCNVGRNNIMWQ